MNKFDAVDTEAAAVDMLDSIIELQRGIPLPYAGVVEVFTRAAQSMSENDPVDALSAVLAVAVQRLAAQK